MSSHHVIREAQEPALLILQSYFLTASHIAPLLEWSPTIVVLEEALQEVVKFGIKVDAVVYKQEQESQVKGLLQEQAPLSFIPAGPEEVPLLKALIFLATNGHAAVNILAENFYQDISILQKLSAQEYIQNVVVLSGEEKSSLCRSARFTKWFPAGEEVTVQPVKQKLTLSTRGFARNCTEEELRGQQVFRTEGAGMISISAGDPFWLTEKLT